MVRVAADDIFWLEGRPAEAGRSVLVHRSPDGTTRDVTPAPFNVRTRVHEYGGGAYVVAGDWIYFSNFSDQRLYRVSTRQASTPVPITPEGRWCFADAVVDSARQRLVCVREDHTVEGREAVTTLVSVPIDGAGGDAGEVIAWGYDFYSTPRVSPDGARISWLCWRHPHMPWDETELWVAGRHLQRGACQHGTRGRRVRRVDLPGGLAAGRFAVFYERPRRLVAVVPRHRWARGRAPPRQSS
jgi:hypothetical protein